MLFLCLQVLPHPRQIKRMVSAGTSDHQTLWLKCHQLACPPFKRQESDIQSLWLMLGICSWGPMAAGQRGFLWFPHKIISRGLPTQGSVAVRTVWAPLDVISPNGTSPPCSNVSSRDSTRYVLHHKPLMVKRTPPVSLLLIKPWSEQILSTDTGLFLLHDFSRLFLEHLCTKGTKPQTG